MIPKLSNGGSGLRSQCGKGQEWACREQCQTCHICYITDINIVVVHLENKNVRPGNRTWGLVKPGRLGRRPWIWIPRGMGKNWEYKCKGWASSTVSNSPPLCSTFCKLTYMRDFSRGQSLGQESIRIICCRTMDTCTMPSPISSLANTTADRCILPSPDSWPQQSQSCYQETE